MKKISLILLFLFLFISLGAYKVKKDEIIRVETLYIYKNFEIKNSKDSIKANFSIKKEDMNKGHFKILDIGIENFIKQVGYENVLDIKKQSYAMGVDNTIINFNATIIYKEKKK